MYIYIFLLFYYLILWCFNVYHYILMIIHVAWCIHFSIITLYNTLILQCLSLHSYFIHVAWLFHFHMQIHNLSKFHAYKKITLILCNWNWLTYMYRSVHFEERDSKCEWGEVYVNAHFVTGFYYHCFDLLSHVLWRVLLSLFWFL